ncbi:uncharacterized protein [Watersipora subatra]|uniref:uncharacterized protein n=1 Tax=Watersipora subatra TaxID=2589382 RepID=UPI00355B8BBC
MLSGLVVAERVRGTCLQTCLNGRCIENTCNCFEGYIGTDCTQQLCGTDGKLCEEGRRCFDNLQCCTNTQCFPPLSPAIANEDAKKGLPTAAVIGIVCIVLIAAAVGVALVVAKYRGHLFNPAPGGTSGAKHSPSQKSDGIRRFQPAADVSSVDYVTDVTGHWTRTPSNAANEAEGVQLPYKAPSAISNDKTLAWEESDRKLAPNQPEESKSRVSAQLDAKPPVAATPASPKTDLEPAKPQGRRKSAPKKKK